MLNSPIEEIKNRLDIVEVIGIYLKLQKVGANFRTLCPFHSEKKPSFFVSPARQIWHCFGCGKGGSIFNFVMEIEGVEFGDALRMLAQRAGVEFKPMKPELRTERQRLYEIYELATRFFERQLSASLAGQEIKKYLLKRGISEDSIKKWRLGYAPDTWQGLTNFLVDREYQGEEIEKAGLVIKNDQGSLYDRFRGRIIFPIFDLNSQIVGFGGRIQPTHQSRTASDEIAKYINTPNTLLYNKSQILYGLDKAKIEIRQRDNCILVEGYTDVIMAHQAGTQNVVATSGTTLTSYQLKIIKRYTENLILGFDMDLAGDSATKRGIDLAQSLGFNLKVACLPEGKDAAEIIFKNPKEWERALENSKSILEFYFQSAFSGRDPKTIEGKKEISKILLPVLKRIPNQIERDFGVQKLAKELEVKEESIEEELKKVKLEEEIFGSEPEEQINPPPKSRKKLLEERLVTLILKNPKNLHLQVYQGTEEGDKKLALLELIKNQLTYFSPPIREILIKLAENQKINSDFFDYLALKAEVEEIEEKEILPDIQFCLKEIQTLEVKNRLNQISEDLKKAESEKDFQKVEKLTKEFNQLAKNIT